MNMLNLSAKLKGTAAAPTSQCGQVPTRRSVVSVGASEQTVVVIVCVVVLLKLSNLRLEDVGSKRKGKKFPVQVASFRRRQRQLGVSAVEAFSYASTSV